MYVNKSSFAVMLNAIHDKDPVQNPPVLLQITFVSFVYPALLLCYAGQSAFISKNSDRRVVNFNHLSKSIPGNSTSPIKSLFICLLQFLSPLSSYSK